MHSQLGVFFLTLFRSHTGLARPYARPIPIRPNMSPPFPTPRAPQLPRSLALFAALLAASGCGDSKPPQTSSGASPAAPIASAPNALNPVQAALEDGVKLAHAGKLPEAVATFDRGLRLEPENGKLRHEKGVALVHLNAPAQAEAEFTLGIEAEPGRWDNWYDRGIARMQLGRTQEAEADFKQSLELNPRNEAGHYNLGYLLESQAVVVLGAVSLDVEKLGAAAQCYQRAIDVQPAFDGARARLGLVYAQLGRIEDARREFGTVLASNPQQPLALLEGARLELRAGEIDVAQPLVERLLEVSPDSAEAHYVAGQLAEERSEPERARTAYERAFELDASHAQALYRLAAVRETLGDAAGAQQARDAYAEVERLGGDVAEKLAAMNSRPTDPRAKYEYAKALARARRYDQALQTYNQLIALDPAALNAVDPKLLPRLWLEMGLLQLDKKRDAKAARVCFENTLTRQPNNALAHSLAGKACLGLKDYESAVEHLKAALQGAPDQLLEAYSDLGLAYLMQNKIVDAIGILEAGLAKAPTHVRMLQSLAGARLQRGDVAQAKAHYEQVLKLDPRNSTARTRLGEIAAREAQQAAGGGAAVPPSAAQPVVGDAKEPNH
jgi:tetratricopeptide (TPR) repeat protein